MLFKDILDQKTRRLYPAFDRLYQLAGQNQTHPGDLLLVHENASYYPEVHKWTNIQEKLSPYMIGPNDEGHSYYTQYNYIGHYVQNIISKYGFQEYQQLLNASKDKRSEREALEFEESISIQNEMLIYLKIWESDIFIKQLYQLVLLLQSKPYDWHFKIKNTVSDPGTGLRHELIRTHIRDNLKAFVPDLYAAIKKVYKSQIRNAIAHSQYYIYGRVVTLTNYVEGHNAHVLKSVKFDDWIDIMHETVVLYTQIQRILNQINMNYGRMSQRYNNTIEVRISRFDPIEKVEYLLLKYDADWKSWSWFRNSK